MNIVVSESRNKVTQTLVVLVKHLGDFSFDVILFAFSVEEIYRFITFENKLPGHISSLWKEKILSRPNNSFYFGSSFQIFILYDMMRNEKNLKILTLACERSMEHEHGREIIQSTRKLELLEDKTGEGNRVIEIIQKRKSNQSDKEHCSKRMRCASEIV